jgi:TolB-like protein
MQLGSDMGNPREAGYFNDGITEDIITKLFRFSERYVIARNLSFRYRDSHVDLHAVIGRKVLGDWRADLRLWCRRIGLPA